MPSFSNAFHAPLFLFAPLLHTSVLLLLHTSFVVVPCHRLRHILTRRLQWHHPRLQPVLMIAVCDNVQHLPTVNCSGRVGRHTLLSDSEAKLLAAGSTKLLSTKLLLSTAAEANCLTLASQHAGQTLGQQ